MRPAKLNLKLAKEYVRYDPKTGKFYWIKATRVHAIGDEAGTVLTRGGTIGIAIKRNMFAAHRLAWAYTYPDKPMPEMFYRKDGDPINNRINNLIPISLKEHMAFVMKEQLAKRQGKPKPSRLEDYL